MNVPQATQPKQTTHAAVRLVSVSKSFGDVHALQPLSLDVMPGETVALLGPSGSGKSTLLNLMAALHAPDSGELYLHGKRTSQLRPGRELSRLVGIMHQQFDLVPSLPVVHNVLAGRLGEWSLFRSLLSLLVPQDLDRARQALDRVGILDKLHERTAHLSGGEQQRVALARLLVQAPQIVLADEPVASLDPARAEDLIAMLVGIAKERHLTLVVSLHSVELALKYFSRILALRQGRLLFDRPSGDVSPGHLKALYALEGVPAEGVPAG